MKPNINHRVPFEHRHNGPDNDQIGKMLEAIGTESLESLMGEIIPRSIALDRDLSLPDPQTEFEFLDSFRKLAQKNKLFKSFIGMGYYPCILPPVIQRNILENPGWYTAYTPYQAEIAQGRLEALVNFQTTVLELTGMELANSSLLDEGTAAAEAMTMLGGLTKGTKKSASKFFVDQAVFPQTIDVLKTRAQPIGIELVIGDWGSINFEDQDLYGVLLQYPDGNGTVYDYSEFIEKAHNASVFVAIAADLLSLTLLKSPGEMGADVVVGSSQRFGIPMGYGGPHAGYFATRESFKRQVPGRIIGVSKDQTGHHAYRMALQTREQHIRREKATSNICTAQVLLAVMAGMYAVYHGPDGLKSMALRIHGLARVLNQGLQKLGYKQSNEFFFDTLKVQLENEVQQEGIKVSALLGEMNLRYYPDASVGISLDETTTLDHVEALLTIFAKAVHLENTEFDLEPESIDWPQSLVRKSEYLAHPVFNKYHTEHEMLRYLKRLENKDLSLVHSMISLGSCTMKLNATSEMIPVTWPELGGLHPFAPRDQALGYRDMFGQLETWLNEITGFAATSLQPNSGAQGEFAGLMVIRAYHQSRGEGHRNITLIPSSAHGTNPASAVMAGGQVVIVKCDDQGNIDLEDLMAKAQDHRENLAALMVTYPSTHGVYEEKIKEIC
ncbi:MAG: aminomethyl-transferring glycine dehydrogenase, partial [Cyclobacteriaceae bacterium]